MSTKRSDGPEDYDADARARNVFGVKILRCLPGRRIEIATPRGKRVVVDLITNSGFDLNLNDDVVHDANAAVRDFRALHVSVAAARAQTWHAAEICSRLADMKGRDSMARIYPSTLHANIAVGCALKGIDCEVFVHPNAHQTVQFALDGALDSRRITRSQNVCGVAKEFAKTSHRPVAIVEDSLYSTGKFACFSALQDFLDHSPSGLVWLDDAHSFGLRGKNGRGEAMERMQKHSHRCVVTGSFGKVVGAAGGFLVGPADFVQGLLESSVPDRFSCNADIASQGATLAALEILAQPGKLESLQAELAERLTRVDTALAAAGIQTEQSRQLIPFRVISFPGPREAISAAGTLLDEAGCLTTPVFYPTIKRGAGAIRISISVGHSLADLDKLVAALVPLLDRRKVA